MHVPLPGPPAVDPPQVVVVQEPVPPTPNLLQEEVMPLYTNSYTLTGTLVYPCSLILRSTMDFYDLASKLPFTTVVIVRSAATINSMDLCGASSIIDKFL